MKVAFINAVNKEEAAFINMSTDLHTDSSTYRAVGHSKASVFFVGSNLLITLISSIIATIYHCMCTPCPALKLWLQY